MKLIYEKSQSGPHARARLPRHDLPVPEVPDELAPRASRRACPRSPSPTSSATSPSSRRATSAIDTGFYPLGSCTMKHNPRVNERARGAARASATSTRTRRRTARRARSSSCGELQEILAEVAGLDAVSLQPAAGSQGELTGLMLMRAYFAERGEGEQRRKIVIPDTAHGTNPASVTMAGYELDAGQDRPAREHRPRRPARRRSTSTPPG